MAARKTLLIVYHSFTDGTRQMAEAARAGATADEGCTARLLHAAQAGAPDVLAADGYLFATPENLAAMSGQLKDFFDRSYYAVLDRVNGRPYASRSLSAPTHRRPRPFWRPSKWAPTIWSAAARWARRWRRVSRWEFFNSYLFDS